MMSNQDYIKTKTILLRQKLAQRIVDLEMTKHDSQDSFKSMIVWLSENIQKLQTNGIQNLQSALETQTEQIKETQRTCESIIQRVTAKKSSLSVSEMADIHRFLDNTEQFVSFNSRSVFDAKECHVVLDGYELKITGSCGLSLRRHNIGDEQQDNTQTLHTLEPSETLHTPESSETLYTPESSETLHTPESSETLCTPESSETLYTPESSETLHTPELSERADTQPQNNLVNNVSSGSSLVTTDMGSDHIHTQTGPQPPIEDLPTYSQAMGYMNEAHLAINGIPSYLHQEDAKDMNVRTSSDGQHCEVASIAFLRDGRIVVADKRNNKLKLFDGELKFNFEVCLPLSPFAVAEAPSGKLVVTMPELNTFFMYNVHDRLSTYQMRTPINGKCYGATGTTSYLFVENKDKGDGHHSIFVYDVRDLFVRSISLKSIPRGVHHYKQMGSSPNGQYLYIKHISMGTAKIICMTTEGEVKWKMKLKDKSSTFYDFAALNFGLLVSMDGVSFISGEGSNWETIGRIKCSGILAVSKDMSKLAISYREGSEEHKKDIISIHSMRYLGTD